MKKLVRKHQGWLGTNSCKSAATFAERRVTRQRPRGSVSKKSGVDWLARLGEPEGKEIVDGPLEEGICRRSSANSQRSQPERQDHQTHDEIYSNIVVREGQGVEPDRRQSASSWARRLGIGW